MGNLVKHIYTLTFYNVNKWNKWKYLTLTHVKLQSDFLMLMVTHNGLSDHPFHTHELHGHNITSKYLYVGLIWLFTLISLRYVSYLTKPIKIIVLFSYLFLSMSTGLIFILIIFDSSVSNNSGWHGLQ